MGVREWLGFGEAAPVVLNEEGPAEPSFAPISVTELVERYEIVEVVENDGEPFIVVADRSVDGVRKFAEVDAPNYTELGSSSPSPFTSMTRVEYNRDLLGYRGLETYDKMRRSNGKVRGALRLLKTPVLAARWFVEPASDSDEDKKIAEFVWSCYEDYPTYSMMQTLTETLLMVDFGYYMFEKVWTPMKIEGKERIVIKKFAPRHPMDVKKWVFDNNGGPKEVVFYPPAEWDRNVDITIPIEKLLVFTLDMEAGNIQGISALRAMYMHWYYIQQLYKIDAIQKERHGIGVPMIKLPVGFTATDKATANNLGRNLRTNERAHVVVPPNWEVCFLKLEGNVVDALKSVEHHNDMILASILGEDISNSDQQIIFLKATRYIADIICSVHNKHFIPELVRLNFGKDITKFPKLKARRIGEYEDWRQMSFALRNMIGARVIEPDDPLEASMRDEMDLPIKDPDTVRQVETPQAPGTESTAGASNTSTIDPNKDPAKPGMPKQAPVPKVAPPGKNAGFDHRGRP